MKTGNRLATAKLKCPECGSEHVIAYGYRVTRKGKVQRYQCKDCGRIFT